MPNKNYTNDSNNSLNKNNKYNNSGNKSKKNKKKKHKVLKTILLILLILFLIGMGLLVGVIVSILNGAGSLSRADFEIDNLTTIIYDKYGNEYTRLHGDEDRQYVTLDKMSPYLPKAFISIEDERFESHIGIDIKRTAAAVVTFVLTGNSDFGGSTITQQLIKKVTEDNSRSWQRKAREIVRAIQVETWLTKDQIIELYMNLIYLGEGASGVETASYTYFNKSSSDLTIAECALIAGLAQAPEGRNPYNNPEGAKNRQELVLGKMYELGYITKEQYDEAMAQELVYQKGEIESSNSYFVDAIISKLSEDLQSERGVTPQMAQTMIYTKGLKIYSTIDPDIQSSMEEVFLNNDYFKLRNGNYDPELQAAMVVIDYKNGDVVGLIGGAGEKKVLRGLNRALVARPPGSTIKPLATYAPGIDAGIFTAATTFDDVPYTTKIGTTVWSPSNSYSQYRGLTCVRKAIEISSNVIAAKAFAEVGVTTSMEYLRKFGITTLTTSDAVPGALALGGLTKGIMPLEHASAYGAIANSGIRLSPKLYTKVFDKNDELIINKTSELSEVISPESAFIVTSMLRDVITGSEATGGSAMLSRGMPAAGKTGTTNNSKDRWFAGFTPYYVASTWVGYDKPKTVNVSGNPAARIWKAVMNKVHENLEVKSFPPKPSGVVQVEVCADSGLLATDLCRNDRRGDRTKTEYFSKGNIPTEECNVHELVSVCPESFKRANPTCIMTCGTVDIVCLNRHYETPPSKLPKDYDYEAPATYCEYHYCEKDEYGNFVTPIDFVWPETNNNNNNGNNINDYTEGIPDSDNNSGTSEQNNNSKNTNSNNTNLNNNSGGNTENNSNENKFWWE